MNKPDRVPDWKIQRAFEAYCKQYNIVGIALFMRLSEAHRSEPIVECACSTGDERVRTAEFAAGMVGAVAQAVVSLRPHKSIAGRE